VLQKSGGGSSGSNHQSDAGQGCQQGHDKRVKKQRRSPFRELRYLRIVVNANSLPPLALLLGSITSLVVEVERDLLARDPSALIFASLATLHQLRHLEVWLPRGSSMAPAHLRALHRLTQLRELAVIADAAHGIDDADVAVLLRALGHLRLLDLKLRLPRLSRGVLWSVAMTGSFLQRLTIYEPQDLSLTLDYVEDEPLFPHLTCLEVGDLVVEEGLYGRSV
jgi:hypothetical protein